MHRANERRRYIVTSSCIGSVHTQNDSCIRNPYKTTQLYIYTNFHYKASIKQKTITQILNPEKTIYMLISLLKRFSNIINSWKLKGSRVCIEDTYWLRQEDITTY